MTESESEHDDRSISYLGTFLKWVAVLSIICFTSVDFWIKIALVALLAIREIVPGTRVDVSHKGIAIQRALAQDPTKGYATLVNKAEPDTVLLKPENPKRFFNFKIESKEEASDGEPDEE